MTGDTAPATVTGAALPRRCPKCNNDTVFALSGGAMLCGSCRHEWNVHDPHPAIAQPDPYANGDPADVVQATGAHITHVDVTVQDVDTLHIEVRRQTVMTAEAHTRADACRFAASNAIDALAVESPDNAYRTLTAHPTWSSQPFADDPDDRAPATTDVPTEVDRAADVSGGSLANARVPGSSVTDDNDDDVGNPLAHLIAHEVVTASGDHVIVREFVDDDTVRVENRHGRKLDLPIDSLVEDVTARRQSGALTVDLDDVEARALAATYALGAALTIEAGAAMVDGTGPAATVGVAPSGWLPFDTDESALVEQMAACAVAALIRAFDLPRDTVAMIATTLRVEAQTGDQTGSEEQ